MRFHRQVRFSVLRGCHLNASMMSLQSALLPIIPGPHHFNFSREEASKSLAKIPSHFRLGDTCSLCNKYLERERSS